MAEKRGDKILPNASAAAPKCFGFGGTVDSRFTQDEMKKNLIVREQRPPDLAFPTIDNNEILLIPDQVEGLRAAVLHKRDLTGAFKIEFEYRIWNKIFQGI